MNNDIFSNYTQSPEIDTYVEHRNGYEDTHYVQGSVEVKPMPISIDWLFQSYNNGLVASLSPYLQRVLLTKVWKAKEYAKAKSYIRDIWKGLGPSTPFFLVPIDLVLNNIEGALVDVDDKDVVKQIKEVKRVVTNKQKDGVLMINLDGQTRSNEAILPYVKGEFPLESEFWGAGLNVLGKDGEWKDVSNKLFTDLDEVQKGYFLSRQILVNILLSGDLDDITGALISINSNEKLTKWQEVYHGSFKSPIGTRIFEVIEDSETGPVRDFLSKKCRQNGDYDFTVSGWEQFIAEHLYFLRNKTVASLDDLSLILKGIEKSPERKYSKKLKKYMLEIIDNYSSDNKLTHQQISNYVLLKDVLDNHSTNNNPYYMNFNIPKLSILSDSKFLTWYLQKDIELREKWEDKKNGVPNPKSYHIINGVVDKLPDSFPAHCSGGYKLKSIVGRLKILINELNLDVNRLKKNRVVSESVSAPKKSTVVVNNDWKTLGGGFIDPTKTSYDTIERGHINANALGGSLNDDNFVPETKKSNRLRGARNIITADN